jgi:hypothetical protein
MTPEFELRAVVQLTDNGARLSMNFRAQQTMKVSFPTPYSLLPTFNRDPSSNA